jgi:imidazolonepropionase-like amidohydrolase
MRINRTLTAAALAGGLMLAAAPAATQGTFAITGGTVHTMTGAPIEGGTVLVRDGRIVAVGRDVSIPQGAVRIDATGRQVTPGLIDSGTQVGLVEVGAVAGTVDRDMVTGPRENLRSQIRAAFTVTDGINPNSTVIPVTRIAGITTVVSRPGFGLVAGQGAVIDLAGRTLDEMVVRSPSGMFVRIGEGVSPITGARGATMMILREMLEDARTLTPRTYERGAVREFTASRLDLIAMQRVLNGEMPMVMEAHRASDILAALRMAEDYGFRLVLTGATEAWMVADEIAAAGVPVVVKVMQNLPGSFERLGATFENAARLHVRGVQVALTSGDTHNARNLRQEAGNAVAHGMPWEAALRALTTEPAAVWGLEGYGTLAPGSVANVVVWDGDPLEIMTPVAHVFIRGREVPLVSRQTQLRDRYMRLDDYRSLYDRTQR